ncbi:glycosyltransferase family 1 protein [Candidatus Bathyarchaeota archaeon]|nr:MAG: glycosyltransferase family 1 protein [Candidatus Bathyarchaeota archaeon]
MTEARICYISPLSIHTYRWVEAFTQKNYEITLITDSRTWVAPRIHFIPVYVLPPLTKRTLLKRLLPNMLTITRLLQKIKPDIVNLHVQHYYSPTIILNKLPFILTSWGIEVLTLPDTNIFLKTLAKIAATKAHTIIADAKCLKEIWVQTGVPESKIKVVPFGVDMHLFNPKIDGSIVRDELKIKEDDIVIISNRAFYNNQYNIECLVNAIPLILERHPNVKFILKGAGPLETYLKSLVKKLDVSQHVRFVGLVPYNEMAQYLKASDIYVSTCFVDSTSVSLLEAMACGLPPVVTDIPGNTEWITNGRNGLLYPPKDFAALAEKIVQLIENPTQRKLYGQRCNKIIKQKATWEKSVAEVEKIYKACLEL